MIQLLKQGDYQLIETKNAQKILILSDKGAYHWKICTDHRELVVVEYFRHASDYIVAAGKYRLYEVENESNLASCIHLELSVGKRNWQGYLWKTNQIMPTLQIITKATGPQAYLGQE